MAKKVTKKDKKEEPLVVRTPADSIYKAFIFTKEPPEMMTDVSGDTFSHTPEDAVYNCLEKLPKHLLLRIPFGNFFQESDPLEVADDLANPMMSRILVVRLFANYDEEYAAAVKSCEDIDCGPHAFWLRLKDLKEGYSMGLQEYTFSYLQIKMTSKDYTELKALQCDLVVPDRERCNPSLPEEIHIDIKG